jgi:hypothetical protein
MATVGLMILVSAGLARAASEDGSIVTAVGPMTRSAASRGKDLERAARMAVDEANASVK